MSVNGPLQIYNDSGLAWRCPGRWPCLEDLEVASETWANEAEACVH